MIAQIQSKPRNVLYDQLVDFFKEISTFLVVGCLPVSIGACAPWLLCTANVQLPRGSSALWVGIRWGFLVQLDKSYLQKVKSTSGLHFSIAKKRLIKTWPCPISLSDLDSNIFWPQCVWNSQALRSRVLWGTLRFFGCVYLKTSGYLGIRSFANLDNWQSLGRKPAISSGTDGSPSLETGKWEQMSAARIAGQQGSIFIDVLGVVYKATKDGHARKFMVSIKAIQFGRY